MFSKKKNSLSLVFLLTPFLILLLSTPAQAQTKGVRLSIATGGTGAFTTP